MVDFAAADDTIFSTFGVAALYLSVSAEEDADPEPVTIVRAVPTSDAGTFGVTLRADAQIVHVRVAEAPSLAKGDTFTIGSEVLTVRGKPERDRLGLMWTAEC
jgi:hypothetical protein